MNKQKVYNYVTNTPYNTNPNVLGSLLNEPTSWNDLTDRPFGEESAVFLDWNGDTTGLETAYLDMNGEQLPYFYRVGDAVPYTLHEINALAETAEFKTINSAGFTDVEWGNAQQFAEDGTYVFAINYMEDPETNAMTVVVNSMADNFDIGAHLLGVQCILPSKGLWVMANCVAFQYVAFEQANTIDPKYIPDTIARTSDLQTISDSISTLVGDTSVADQIDTALANSQADWNVNDESDSAYVKNRPFYTGDVVKIAYLEGITLPKAGDGQYGGEMEIETPNYSSLAEGQTISVVLDGVEHTGTIFLYNSYLCAGNMGIIGGEDTGESYFIIFADGMMKFVALVTSDVESITASIYVNAAEVHQIEEKYLSGALLPKMAKEGQMIAFTSGKWALMDNPNEWVQIARINTDGSSEYLYNIDRNYIELCFVAVNLKHTTSDTASDLIISNSNSQYAKKYGVMPKAIAPAGGSDTFSFLKLVKIPWVGTIGMGNKTPIANDTNVFSIIDDMQFSRTRMGITVNNDTTHYIHLFFTGGTIAEGGSIWIYGKPERIPKILY